MKARRGYKKKGYRRKRTFISAYPRYSTMPGLKSIVTIKMPYHMETVATAAGFTYTTFNSNSIYAPQYSGGHQPRSHDQWAQYYKYYRVTYMTISSHFSWEETPSQSFCVGIYLDDNASFYYSGSNDLYEKSGFKYTRALLPDRSSRVIIKRRLSLRAATNKTTDQERTAFGASPDKAGPLFHVWALPNNTGSLSYGGVRIHTCCIYTVQLFEPLDIGGS